MAEFALPLNLPNSLQPVLLLGVDPNAKGTCWCLHGSVSQNKAQDQDQSYIKKYHQFIKEREKTRENRVEFREAQKTVGHEM